jgi:hypothetical protein
MPSGPSAASAHSAGGGNGHGGSSSNGGAAAAPAAAAPFPPGGAVFVSYSWGAEAPPGSGERPLQRRALRVAAAIRAHTRGFVWVDVEQVGKAAQGAGGLNDAMAAGIDRCDAFVACMSESYTTSVNCKRELEYADNRGKCILYVNVGEPG